MLLFVGLGNPGEPYKNTRHNIGREIAEAARKEYKLPDFRFEKKWKALVSEGKIGESRHEVGTPTSLSKSKKVASGEKIALVLPETFMNKSGNAVGPITRFFKTKPKNIFIIHDDADLPLGRAKLSFGKNSAGHKGVESVMRALKTKEFWRLRVGIGGKRNIPAEKIVLRKLSADEQKEAKKITRQTLETIEIIAKEGPECAMNSYNT